MITQSRFPTKTTSFTAKDEFLEELEKACAGACLTRSEFIRKAVLEKIEKEQKK